MNFNFAPNFRLVMCFFAVSGLDLLDALDQLSDEKKEQIREWVYHLLLQSKDAGLCAVLIFL